MIAMNVWCPETPVLNRSGHPLSGRSLTIKANPMNNSKTSTAFGIGMILGGIPCTLAGVLILHLIAGRHAQFDVIGIVMMTFLAYMLAVGTCVAGLLYFSIAAQKKSVALRTWHWFAFVYSFSQVMIATIYITTYQATL